MLLTKIFYEHFNHRETERLPTPLGSFLPWDSKAEVRGQELGFREGIEDRIHLFPHRVVALYELQHLTPCETPL